MAEQKRLAPEEQGLSPDHIRLKYPDYYRSLILRMNEIKKREEITRLHLDEQVLGAPGDEADLSVIDSSTDYFTHLATSHQMEILEIREALDRMHRGVYGICENCEQPITPERLHHLPAARCCIDCQTQQERSVLTTIPGGKRSSL